MREDKKQRLMALGADALADALLELAGRDEAADDLLERMIATPMENIKRFKAKLSRIKRSRRFISWGESGAFARELETLLQDLKAGVADPCSGAAMVAAFYETDKGVFDNCDDSSGHVGDVYRYDAMELFVEYAARCEDKKRLEELVLKLNRKDDYGVRDALIDCASQYLPEPDIRDMIFNLQRLADKETGEYNKRHLLHLIESLARQIKDAPLFEKTRIANWGKLSTAGYVDIAQVYLESGDAGIALSWLERIPEKDTYQASERDQLLLEIYGRLQEPDKQAEAGWRTFRRFRGADSLKKLLAIIGQDNRDNVIAGEVAAIVEKKSLVLQDAGFLIEIGRMDEAEAYLIDRADQLNGDFYEGLLPLAVTMEKNGRALVASVLYRALLDSILRRAQTKTYPHGVRYLKKLDKLAASISDWRAIESHAAYLEHLRQKHGRKTSFWPQYDK